MYTKGRAAFGSDQNLQTKHKITTSQSEKVSNDQKAHLKYKDFEKVLHVWKLLHTSIHCQNNAQALSTCWLLLTVFRAI